MTPVPSRGTLEKVAFVLSLAALAFLYGFASSTRGWFPNDLLVRAWHQAQALVESDPPEFVWPRTYDREGVQLERPEDLQPGLTLISATWWEDDGWKPGLDLVDAEGHPVHSWRLDPGEVFPDSAVRTGGPVERADLHGSYLFPNGDVLVNVEPVGTVRLDACGRVLWSLPAGSHHSIARADDGSFWIPGTTREIAPNSPDHPEGLPGFDRTIYHDLILRISEAGEVLDRLHLLDLLYANGLERYLFKAERLWTEDPVHLNDVEPLSAAVADEYPLFDAGDLVASVRELDLVFVFDPESRRVKWHASEPFIAQHDPDFLGEGWIGVFDNNKNGWDRGRQLGGSRIVAVQPHTDSLKVLFPTSRSEPFYTPIMGKWQQLPNGNLLLTESLPARVVEVAPDGGTVWEWVKEPSGEDSVTEVNEASRHDLTRADVEAWSCSESSSLTTGKELQS